MSLDYGFRRVGPDDLAMIHHWREQPHVRVWWGDPSDDRAEEKVADPRIAMWIVLHHERPFAFAQDYDVHGWANHPSRICRRGRAASISLSASRT